MSTWSSLCTTAHTDNPPCEWCEFMQEWWGTPRLKDALAGNRRIRIGQSTVYSSLGILQDSLGSLYIRAELMVIFQRLRGVPSGVPGVVLTGQRGCGISSALVLFLLLRMASKSSTYFSTPSGTTYLIDGSGIRRKRSVEITFEDIHRSNTSSSSTHSPSPPTHPNLPPPNTLCWSLVDYRQDSDRLPENLMMNSSLFTVRHGVASARNDRYLTWLIPAWSVEDLTASLQLQTQFYHFPDDLRIRCLDRGNLNKILATCAPNPLDLYIKVFDLWRYQCELDKAVLKYKNLDRFRSLLQFPPTSDQSLVLLRRLPRGSSYCSDDVCVPDFASEYVCNAMQEIYRILEFDQVRLFLNSCPVIPERSNLSSWIFESLVVNSLTRPHESPFTASMMVQIEERTFVHKTADFEKVLCVAEQGAFTEQCSYSLDFPTQLSLPLVFPKYEQYTLYKDIQRDVRAFSRGRYFPFWSFSPGLYLPFRRSAHPILDGFCFERNGFGKLVLWIIHIVTSTRRQAEGDDNYHPIKVLRQMALDKGYRVEVRYALFVPKKEVQVIWELPTGWEMSGVEGKVLVTYLDLNSVEGRWAKSYRQLEKV